MADSDPTAESEATSAVFIDELAARLAQLEPADRALVEQLTERLETKRQ